MEHVPRRRSSRGRAAASRAAGFRSRRRRRNGSPTTIRGSSLEERYGTHDGYVAMVRKAAEQAVRDRFLLPDDAARIVREAEASDVLRAEHSRPRPRRLRASSSPRSRCRTRRSRSRAPTRPASSRRGRTFQVPAFCRVAVDRDADRRLRHQGRGLAARARGTANCSAPTTAGSRARSTTAALAGAITKGYAAVSTDTGHTGDQMDFGIGHPEKIVDWAHRAVHEMTVIAKAVVETGRRPGAAAVVLHRLLDRRTAGAQRSAALSGRLRRHRRRRSRQQPHQPDLRLPLVVARDARCRTARRSCRARSCRRWRRPPSRPATSNDGLEDGLIGDPRTCRFDPAALACTASRDGRVPDAAADRSREEGLRRRATRATGGSCIPAGRPAAKSGWGTYITNPGSRSASGCSASWVFQNPVVGSAHVRLGQGRRHRERGVSDAERDVNGLRGVQRTRRQADHVHGPRRPGRLAARHDRVLRERREGDRAASTRHRRFYRFFPVPGMAHCGGGAGTNTFDALAALEAWVEHGTAPDCIPRITLNQRPRRSHAAAVRVSGRRALQRRRQHR